MNPLKRLAGETALYGISSILGRFLNYLLFPLHTLVFPTRDYGIITELYVFAAFLNIVYLAGLETAYFRFASAHEKDEHSIFNTGITIVLMIALAISTALFFFATDIVNWMGYFGQEHFVYIFAAILAFDAIFAFPFARLRKERKAKRFAYAKLTGIFINIGINLFFLYFCYQIAEGRFLQGLSGFVSTIYSPDFHLEYVFLANLAGSIGVILFLGRQFQGFRLQLDSRYLKKMLNFGYPLLFTGLALVTNEMLSRAALKYWLPENFYPGYTSQEILGIFGGVFKLAILMNLGIQAFRYAAEPFFFNEQKNEESNQLFAKVMNWFILAGCVIWLGVSFNLSWLQYLLRTAEYRVAIGVVPFLLVASLFMGINYTLSAWYKLVDFTKAGTVITFVGALLTIVANYLMIPEFGYYGSAYAAIIAYGSMCIVSYLWSRKHNPIPYNIRRIGLYLLISSAVIFIGLTFKSDDFWLDLAWRNGLLIVCMIFAFRYEKKTGVS